MSALQTQYNELKQLIQTSEFDLQALTTKHTKVSATRFRGSLMKISKLCAALRKETLAYQKSLPTKSRSAKPATSSDSDDSDPVLPKPELVRQDAAQQVDLEEPIVAKKPKRKVTRKPKQPQA